MTPLSLPVRSPVAIPGVTDVLLVCHANQCRSPFAAAIAQRLAEGRRLRFESAGLIPGGHPMPRTGRAVARELSYDVESHRSRQLDAHDIDGFDVILTMAREQARDLLVENSDLWPRLFTLKQFSRWIAENPRPPRAKVGSWLDAAAASRRRADMLGADERDDVADPLLLPPWAWHGMVDDITPHIARIVDALDPDV